MYCLGGFHFNDGLLFSFTILYESNTIKLLSDCTSQETNNRFNDPWLSCKMQEFDLLKEELDYSCRKASTGFVLDILKL